MIPTSIRTNASCFLPFAVLAAILCASCAGPQIQDGEQPRARDGIYSCRGIGQVELRFFDSMGMAQLTRQGRTMQLRQQRSGEVSIYSDGSHSVRRAGKDITVELVSGEPSRCVQSSGSD
jgi:hypothetical protein